MYRERKKKRLNYITKDFLFDEYINQEKSVYKISCELKCSDTTITRKLKKFNISIRNHSKAQLKRKPKFDYILTKEFLEQEYIVNKKSSIQISKEFQISKPCILKYLKKFNIIIRSLKNRTDVICKFCHKMFELNNSQLKRSNYYFCSKNCYILSVKNYHIISCDSCGKQIRVKNYQIKKNINNFCSNKCYGDFRSQYYIQDKIASWCGGVNKDGYSYKFDNKLKQIIRKRDNFKCQCCELKEKDHIRGNKQINLTVHHIDYNKQNCKDTNLITLCIQCNIRANYNRDYWHAFYTYMIGENYETKISSEICQGC